MHRYPYSYFPSFFSLKTIISQEDFISYTRHPATFYKTAILFQGTTFISFSGPVRSWTLQTLPLINPLLYRNVVQSDIPSNASMSTETLCEALSWASSNYAFSTLHIYPQMRKTEKKVIYEGQIYKRSDCRAPATNTGSVIHPYLSSEPHYNTVTSTGAFSGFRDSDTIAILGVPGS